MLPCTQEENIRDLFKLVGVLQVNDGKKEIQIDNLISSMNTLVGWVKALVFVGITTLIALLGFLIHFWVKG